MQNKISVKIRGITQKTIPVINMALLAASCGGNEQDYCIYNDGTQIVDKKHKIVIGCEEPTIRGLGLKGGREWAICYLTCEGNNKLDVWRWNCSKPSVYNSMSNSCVLPEGACQYVNGVTMKQPYEEMRCDDSRVFDALRETVDPKYLTGEGKCSATCLDDGNIKYEYHGFNNDGKIAMIQAIVDNKMHTM